MAVIAGKQPKASTPDAVSTNEKSIQPQSSETSSRKVYSKEFLLRNLSPKCNTTLLLKPFRQLPTQPAPLQTNCNDKGTKTSSKKKWAAWNAFMDPLAQQKYSSFKIRMESLLAKNSPLEMTMLKQMYKGAYGEPVNGQDFGLPDFSMLQLLGTVPGIELRRNCNSSSIMVSWQN